LMKTLTKRNLLMIWKEEEVLIYGEKENQFFGRTRNYKEVFFQKNQKYKVWDLVKVKIDEIDKWVLRGKIVN
jgi:tRNA A37 methylthiotransferase MiaB